MILVASIIVALLGICLIAFLRVDLLNAKSGRKSIFWERRK